MEQEELQVIENAEVKEPELENSHYSEEQSKTLLGKVKTMMKVIKWLVIAAGIVAGILLVYGILAITVMDDQAVALIGFIVLLAIEGVLFLAFVAMLVLTKLQLSKLKKAN